MRSELSQQAVPSLKPRQEETPTGWVGLARPTLLTVGLLGTGAAMPACGASSSSTGQEDLVAATPEPGTAPVAEKEEGTCPHDSLEYKSLTDEETPLLIFDSSNPVDTSQWKVVAGEFIRSETSQSETTNTIYLVAISDTAAQQLIGNPQFEEALRVLGASIQALGAKIAVGSQYSLLSIPAAGYFVAVTHPEVGQLQAQADCVGAQLIVRAIRQALNLSVSGSASTECGYPPPPAPTPAYDDGRVYATSNQLEEGKKLLGLQGIPNNELDRNQLIEALEAACPAGGIRERLFHLEGRDGFTAQNLLAQGYSEKDVFFYIIHHIPLPR